MDSESLILTRGTESESRNGAARIFEFLRDEMLGGALKPGDRLLGERELAGLLDVSRPVLREALRALAMLGILDIRHGSGTFVRQADISVLRHFFTYALAQQADVVEDVMQARIAIECQAIRLACERATASDLTRIQATLDGIMRTLGDPLTGGEADYRFHTAIVGAAKSRVLVTMYDAIADLLMRSHVERRETTTPVAGIREYLVEAHREVFLSLVRRDPDGAERKLRDHFTIGDEFRRKSILAAYGGRAEEQPERNLGKETRR